MSNATTYTRNRAVNALLRGQSIALPSAIYIALHTANPTVAGNVAEVKTTAWPGYKRIDAAQGGAITDGWGDPVDGLSGNLLQLLWPQHDGQGDITVTHVSYWDAPTGGNALFFGALAAPRTIPPGDVYVVGVNRLTLQVT